MQDSMDKTGLYGDVITAEDYNRLVSFRRRHILPPSMVYVTADDVFVLKILNPTVTATVNVSIRYLDTEGEVVPVFQQFPNLSAQATVRTLNFRGSEGYVLSATISTPGASAGAVYVQLEVGRGLGAQDLTEGHLLIAGYPGSFAALGFPQTQPIPPSAGAGVTRSITVSNPAAGADWTFTVPAGVTWIVNSVAETLVTSGAAATRVPGIILKDASGRNVYTGYATPGLVASLTAAVSFTPGNFSDPGAANGAGGSLPPGLRLQPGATIGSTTVAIQAADQYTNITISVTELVMA